MMHYGYLPPFSALLCVIHGTILENTLFKDEEQLNAFSGLKPIQAEEISSRVTTNFFWLEIFDNCSPQQALVTPFQNICYLSL
ncbi:hypothetical protein [cyanobacterium endosymbiont of Rhopalodia gibberula]|uniref:hypothetical protein n=1 Tax=cyanobacterium endosymbiont of Rhopalodia gibberula TaxID=1763363 RepID=UPI0015591300|nr:hypothetical protein [cyanobacterium endosymbiont of Rhopalodia gibberula]